MVTVLIVCVALLCIACALAGYVAGISRTWRTVRRTLGDMWPHEEN